MNIVYTSNAGHTMEYAKLLASELDTNALTLKEARKVLKKTDEIIYLTWIMAGNPKDLKKALKSYNVKALCTVGMAFAIIDQNSIIEKYKLECPLYYLPGGFDIVRLKGFYKIMMSAMRGQMKKKLESGVDLSDDEKLNATSMVNGCNFVSKEHIEPIVRALRSIKGK